MAMADADFSKELYDFLKGDSVEYRQSAKASATQSLCAAMKNEFFDNESPWRQ